MDVVGYALASQVQLAAVQITEDTQSDFAAGTLTNVVATSAGTLELQTVNNPTFTRSSVAYKSDGTQVAANVPRFEPGKFGQAVMVEEGTTNLFTNPGFETGDFTGWSSTFQSGLDYWKVTTSTSWEGTYSAYLEGTELHSWRGIGLIIDNPTVGATYTASVYGKCDADITYGVYLRIKKSTDGGSTWSVAVIAPTITGTVWQRTSCSYTVEDGVNAIAYEVLSSPGNATGKRVYIDAALFEQKPYATSFIDGTRSPETLTIPTAGVLSATEGTIECWIRLLRAPDTNEQFIFDAGGATNRNLQLVVRTDGKLEARYGTGSSTINVTGTTTLSANTWYAMACRWSSAGVALFLNGSLEASSSTAPSLSFGTNTYIGSRADGTLQLDGLIDDLRISSRARTNDEIAAGYQSGQPLPADEYTTYQLSMDNTLTASKGGNRLSPVYVIPPATMSGGTISWNATVPTGTSLTVETNLSLDGGSTWQGWQVATNGGPIPGISEGMDLSNARLRLRETLTTSDTTVTPSLDKVELEIEGIRGLGMLKAWLATR